MTPAIVGSVGERPRRVLVCGGRNFSDAALLERTLNELNVAVLIEGGARGADRLAYWWAKMRDIPIETYEAQWARDGKAAGPIRNRAMLVNGRPNVVVAFPGGRGTADMMRQAATAGVQVLVIGATGEAQSTPTPIQPVEERSDG